MSQGQESISNTTLVSEVVFSIEKQLKELREKEPKLKKELFEYKATVYSNVIDEILAGNDWWLPHFLQQFHYGIVGTDSHYKDVGEKDPQGKILQERTFKRIKLEESITPKKKEIALGYFGPQYFIFGGSHHTLKSFPHFPRLDLEDINGVSRVKPGWNPNEIYYHFYREMERKNPRGSVAEEYWTNKLKISLGRTTLFFTNVFKDHPELIEDLKATKRMDIFELYEIEMKRRRCFWFLKLVHKKGEGSLFYNEFLPYDILKIILVFAGIFVKRDIPDFWSFNPFADKPKKSRLPGDFYGIDLQSSL